LHLGRAFAAASRFPEALPHFEAAAALTQNREPANLQMRAASTRKRESISTPSTSPSSAADTNLATTLKSNLARYQRQLQQASNRN
jgi:hypothetical protein